MKYEITYGTEDLEQVKELVAFNKVFLLKVLPEITNVFGNKFNMVKIGSDNNLQLLEAIANKTQKLY